MKELADSGEIYQPLAWTPKEAYRFLQSIPVLEASGLIVTNNHVVDDPNFNYTVTLLDGHQFPATVVGLDRYDDVALLKINATGLATVSLGDSGTLETGQTVFAIGNSSACG